MRNYSGQYLLSRRNNRNNVDDNEPGGGAGLGTAAEACLSAALDGPGGGAFRGPLGGGGGPLPGAGGGGGAEPKGAAGAGASRETRTKKLFPNCKAGQKEISNIRSIASRKE